MGIERREYPRFEKTFRVIIHHPFSERNLKTIDVSIAGAAVCYSQKYYHKDQRITIELLLSEDDSIRCDADVKWVSPNSVDAELYRVGLEFIGMREDDKEKLKRAIKG
jgi:c-di-GMP-binding flagellar brake protein YcgR